MTGSALSPALREPFSVRAIALHAPARLPAHELVAAWLLGQTSDHTRDAYRRDVTAWLDWLAEHDVDPFAVRRAHADAWARQMENTPGPRGAAATAATVNRRLAAVSAFYTYLVHEEQLDVNRVAHTKRHKIDKGFSSTFRPSGDEAVAILTAARAHSPRALALVVLLVFSGARVSEALGADISDLGTSMGERMLVVTRKGGAQAELPLRPAALVGGAVDAYLATRADDAATAGTGPIFLDRNGRALTRQAAANLIKEIGARAGCPLLTPHGLRHAFATLGYLAGATKDELQKWLGHADPGTTGRYIARAQEFASHPGDKIARLLGLPT